jgi:hypothetical protein
MTNKIRIIEIVTSFLSKENINDGITHQKSSNSSMTMQNALTNKYCN